MHSVIFVGMRQKGQQMKILFFFGFVFKLPKALTFGSEDKQHFPLSGFGAG